MRQMDKKSVEGSANNLNSHDKISCFIPKFFEYFTNHILSYLNTYSI